MSVKEMTSSNFEVLLQENEIVFVDFWAEWCAPCKSFAVTYEKVASEYKNIAFAQINIEQERELASVFEIRSIPHLMVFKQGIVIYSESGSIPKSTLIELVEQSMAADVSELKKSIDSEK